MSYCVFWKRWPLHYHCKIEKILQCHMNFSHFASGSAKVEIPTIHEHCLGWRNCTWSCTGLPNCQGQPKETREQFKICVFTLTPFSPSQKRCFCKLWSSRRFSPATVKMKYKMVLNWVLQARALWIQKQLQCRMFFQSVCPEWTSRCCSRPVLLVVIPLLYCAMKM